MPETEYILLQSIVFQMLEIYLDDPLNNLICTPDFIKKILGDNTDVLNSITNTCNDMDDETLTRLTEIIQQQLDIGQYMSAVSNFFSTCSCDKL